MIDFTNKCVITESDVESAKLLKMAISQGFALPKGEKVMESCRFFRFIGSPYKSVIALSAVTQEMYDRAILYSHLFGNELEELMKISDLAARWCRTYGYNHLSVYANEEADIYTGRGIAKNKDGAVQDVKIKLNNYCNTDWYNGVLTDALRKYECWIAHYPDPDNGTMQTRVKPKAGIGWQYSSKGKVSGISGNVDMDVFYKDYRGTAQKGETTMVKISNCGHDENGRYAGGKAGDQTGTEYRIMNWYSRPWLCVLRFNDAKIAAMIADMATKAAQNNLIGYDQGTAGNSNDRYSFWQHLKASNYDPAQITVACESDCSASTAAIVKGAGYRLNNAKLKAVSIYLTTRNMRAAMKAAGAKVLTDSKYLTSGDYLKAGDILLNDNHHVAIAVTTGAKVSTPSTTLTGTFQTRLPILRKGSSGTAVAMLQAMLGVEVDGQFGNDTYDSLKVFQKNVGVKANGTCGIDTWKRVIEHMKANTK